MTNIIFLGSADRKCRDCNCIKAPHPEVMRRDPDRYFFTTTQACGQCGDQVEVDCSMLGSAPPSVDACVGCGATEDLVVAEFTVPGGRSIRGCICDDCIERHEGAGAADAATPF